MKLRQILILGLVLSGLSGLRAQTVVQTVQFDETASFTAASGALELVDESFFVGTFDPFDSSLGTLSYFVIEWSLANTATGSLDTIGSISVSMAGYFTFNGSAYQTLFPVVDPTGGPPAPFSLSAPIEQTDTFFVSEAGSDYDPAYLSAVTGDDPFTVGLEVPVIFNVSGSATFEAATVGDVTVTYVYTAVPEPSTYAAIFGTLALVAAAWFRRRAGA